MDIGPCNNSQCRHVVSPCGHERPPLLEIVRPPVGSDGRGAFQVGQCVFDDLRWGVRLFGGPILEGASEAVNRVVALKLAWKNRSAVIALTAR